MNKVTPLDHRARYKNSGLDAKELRRRREADSFQLRKQKREDVLSKRRTLAPEQADSQDDESYLDDESFKQNDSNITITQETVDALMQNDNLELLIENAQKVRKILSKEPQPPFDEVIEKGLMPRFVELLDSPHLMVQFEVAWILTNIASGTSEHTLHVVKHGAVPKLVGLLKSPDMKVCEQAVWALGNIIGDGAETRDLVIGHGFVPALLTLIRPDLEIGFLRNETWVIVNLCRNKSPPPHIDVIRLLIPALSYLIKSQDLAILIDTTWAISYITELGTDYSQLVIDTGLVAQITPLLSHNEFKIQTAAIRALGSIVTGDDSQTQAVIDAGALPHLYRLLKEDKDKIIKDALWFISNISAGSVSQIQAIIDHQLIPSIIYHLDKGDYSQQKEAFWAIFNMSLNATDKQMMVLVEEKVIPPLCNLLSMKDMSVVKNVLECLNSILNNSKNAQEICETIEECGGLDKIEQLQSNSNSEIYTFAYDIIDKYFRTE